MNEIDKIRQEFEELKARNPIIYAGFAIYESQGISVMDMFKWIIVTQARAIREMELAEYKRLEESPAILVMPVSELPSG